MFYFRFMNIYPLEVASFFGTDGRIVSSKR